MNVFLRKLLEMVMLDADSGADTGGSLAGDEGAADTGGDTGGDSGGDTGADAGGDAGGETYAPHTYQAQFQGELKNDPFFKPYENLTAQAIALKESVAKIAELEENATKNVPKVPESPDKYKMLDKTEFDGVSFSEEEVKEIQGIASEVGATQEQFDGLVKKSIAQKKAVAEFSAKRREATVADLKAAWPGEEGYKEGWSRYNAAVTGLEKMGIEGVRDLFKNPAYGDNPVLLKIVSEFGKFFKDDKLLDGSGETISKGTPGTLSYPSMKN